MKNMKEGFYVSVATKTATLDNFNDGENPDTTQYMDIYVKGFFKSIGELANEVGLTPDLGAWMAIDGRLFCSQMENDEGSIISPREYELFKKGEIGLWACEYNFHIYLLTTPTQKELAEKFEIEEY